MPLIKTGQDMIIEHKVPDKNSALFVRARLFDAAGTELAASPINLPHFADGLYRVGTSVPMPNTPFVTVITGVFFDAGFTNTAEEDYTDGVDVFEQSDDYLKTNVVVPRSDEIFIEFDSAELEVLVDEGEELLVEIASETISIDFDNGDIDVEFDTIELEAQLDC